MGEWARKRVKDLGFVRWWVKKRVSLFGTIIIFEDHIVSLFQFLFNETRHKIIYLFTQYEF